MFTAKVLIHQLTNNAQLILGYLELGEQAKALAATKESIRILRQLTRIIGTAYVSSKGSNGSKSSKGVA
jgi:hypothetical protein